MDILVALYIANAVLLILHEMDSSYWKEWNLLKPPSGGARAGFDDLKALTVFLLLHIPLLFLVLYGLLRLQEGTSTGLVLSLVLSGAGLFAFGLHMVFLKKGRPEFRAAISIGILISTLVVSIAQLALTLVRLFAG